MKQKIIVTLVVFVSLALILQVIPYGKDHTNPPVIEEPEWENPEIRALAQRACFDCHSHETVWPWYSNIAPVSWLIYSDVIEGRKHINFSDWNRGTHQHIDEFEEVYEENTMPPATYLFLHPEAKLSDVEKQKLFESLEKLTQHHDE